jgi:L-ascorbate metabolism protein UlaG (beta-lactamase superfamily)
MMKAAVVWIVALAAAVAPAQPALAQAQTAPAVDTFATGAGPLSVTFIAHATLMLRLGALTIHVDPVGRYADYGAMPKADIVLVTHEHGDHLDPAAIEKIRKADTVVIASASAAAKIPGASVMGNGDKVAIRGIEIEAVPAYNTTPSRRHYHPKGRDNGYLLTIGGTRIDIAGDTEDTPEMKALRNIDIAFLPMNLPFTMTPEQVASAALAVRPKVLYPYHYGDTDVALLQRLLAGERGIDVRIRPMQ